MVVDRRRNEWIDVAKGIAIILVVVGHAATFDVTPIYWFHMPAFFMMSGFFFKPMDSMNAIKAWLVKRAKQLFIPYLFFLVVITALRYLVIFYQSGLSWEWLVEDVRNVLIGGRFFPSDFYVVMWFIPCLFLTQVLCALIFYFVKNKLFRFGIILLFYSLAHFETWFSFNHSVFVPLNLDVSLLALPYFVVGYHVHRALVLFKNKLDLTKFVGFTLFAAAIFIITFKRPIAYIFDMRSVTYYHFFLDLLVPITLTIALFIVSALFTKWGRLSSLLNYAGKSSLIIMYTHVPIKIIIETFYSNSVLIIVIGTLLPLFISKTLLEKNIHLSNLVLGKTKTL
ncbi:acyltransferase family protein [Pseudoneobacillus sp. C159]